MCAGSRPIATVPDAYKDLNVHQHNPQVTLMRTTPEENRAVWVCGSATRLNGMEGPCGSYSEGRFGCSISGVATSGSPAADAR